MQAGSAFCRKAERTDIALSVFRLIVKITFFSRVLSQGVKQSHDRAAVDDQPHRFRKPGSLPQLTQHPFQSPQAPFLKRLPALSSGKGKRSPAVNPCLIPRVAV